MMRSIEEGRVFHREGAIVCNGECDKVNPACKPICNVKSNVNVNVKSNVKSSQMSSQVKCQVKSMSSQSHIGTGTAVPALC